MGFLEETYKTIMDGILKRLDAKSQEYLYDENTTGEFRAGFRIAHVMIAEMKKELVQKAKQIEKEESQL